MGTHRVYRININIYVTLLTYLHGSYVLQTIFICIVYCLYWIKLILTKLTYIRIKKVSHFIIYFRTSSLSDLVLEFFLIDPSEITLLDLTCK